ncbi:MAG: hypothetical protein A3J40_00915 [Erythrobacter sp. RIFCSPHIGHO2_12_FULL_63_10]|nr:MAG: hypothetical protein A3J40_00915 [Erythrobacter sp. RIFCSPHIGHO2_12_FULL_63_10]
MCDDPCQPSVKRQRTGQHIARRAAHIGERDALLIGKLVLLKRPSHMPLLPALRRFRTLQNPLGG